MHYLQNEQKREINMKTLYYPGLENEPYAIDYSETVVKICEQQRRVILYDQFQSNYL